MLKIHTDTLIDSETELMSKYLTQEQIKEIEVKVEATRQVLQTGVLDQTVPPPNAPHKNKIFSIIIKM